jgi:alpha-1,3-rhamnosyl/mannosyltransferase
MRVVVNLLAASGRKAGIGHYTVQLLRCLRELAPEVEFDEFPPPWMRGLRTVWNWFHTCGAGKAAAKNGGAAGNARAAAVACARCSFKGCGQAFLRRRFRRRFHRGTHDLYHEPNFIPLPTDLPTVVTIHDLSVLLHPEWHPADRVANYERYFRRGLARCAHYFTISEYTRQEIIQTLNLPAERITRTYMGVRPDLAPLPTAETAAKLQQLGFPAKYLLYFGTLEPRKNILMLMRAYCSLPAEIRERWPLILVGGWGWRTEGIAEYYETIARHKNVRRMGYVADEHAATIYNGARALVYPSLYEGFGMPPMEMLACGGAVLASTAGPIAETAGRQAYLIPPDDFDGWRDGMLRVVQDDEWRQSLRNGATEVARPFTWERCAAETLRVYRAVCDGAAEVLRPRELTPSLPRRAAG